MSQLFTTGGQSFGASASASVLLMISFWIDWFYLLVLQGTLKCLLQHHSSKASIPQCSALFMVQLSHPSMTTGKAIALTIQTFTRKVMSLPLFFIVIIIIHIISLSSFSLFQSTPMNMVSSDPYDIPVVNRIHPIFQRRAKW